MAQPKAMSREEEEVLIAKVLKECGSINPQHLGQVISLTVIGIVNAAWRNSPLEDWHAGPDSRIHDGDMLRVNSHTTWRLRELIHDWRREFEIARNEDIDILHEVVDDEDLLWLGRRIFRWLVNPRRMLPNGVSVGTLAGDELPALEDHAASVLESFVAQGEDRGIKYTLWRTAAHGASACPHWWGHPRWPALVARFLATLDSPTDPHWGEGGKWWRNLGEAPSLMQDRERIRRLLLRAPWKIDSESAVWIVGAGIGSMPRS